MLMSFVIGHYLQLSLLGSDSRSQPEMPPLNLRSPFCK